MLSSLAPAYRWPSSNWSSDGPTATGSCNTKFSLKFEFASKLQIFNKIQNFLWPKFKIFDKISKFHKIHITFAIISDSAWNSVDEVPKAVKSPQISRNTDFSKISSLGLWYDLFYFPQIYILLYRVLPNSQNCKSSLDFRTFTIHLPVFANFRSKLIEFWRKKSKNWNFSFFQFFSKFWSTFVRIFDIEIIYRQTRHPHQIHRSKKLPPEIK